MKRIWMTGAALAALVAMTACGQDEPEAAAETPDAAAAAEDMAAEPAEVAEAPAIDLPADATPAERNLAMSQQFLAQNAARDGVTQTDSGLQYEELEAGPEDGPSPTLDNWVCVDYTGMLPDGSVFDSTQGGQPLALPLSGIIDGWREALPMMSEGDAWRLFIPPELGYGPSGAGAVIPPNAALVFDIHLLRVLDTTDLAVLPDQRVDTSWNCSEPPPAADDADADGADAGAD